MARLEKQVLELGLTFLSETMLPVPEGKLVGQIYYFFVARYGEANEQIQG